MPRFIILDSGRMSIVELADMLPESNVIAEIIDNMVFLKNPFASPCNFWWPENMFVGEPIPLDEFMKQDIK